MRFRLLYEDWKELVEELNSDDLFLRWRRGNKTCAGVVTSPIELLTLGALRVIGCGNTFDSLEESMFISEKVHRCFFKQFIHYGSTELFGKHVRLPKTVEEAQHHMIEMAKAGYAGAVGSTDATNVIIKRCRYQIRQAHLGHKQNKTARSYNVTVNHRREILASTKGHPCTWNDKTLVRYDDFICGLFSGEILGELEFELFERVDNGRVRKRKYKGAWVLTDNGYLPWPVTMPPSKNSGSIMETRWSQWLESMRKDVECTFGMLKKRFRCLDHGIDIGSIEDCDNVFLTRCALHNLILKIDERDKVWEGEVQMDDQDNFAMNRLRNPEGNTISNNEGDTNETEIDASQNNDNTINVVRNLQQSIFKKKLIEHFDIMFQQNKIVWPQRVNKKPRKI